MQKDLTMIFGTNHGLDEKSVQFLAGAIEKNNLPGFDYIEFKQSLQALEKMDFDEPTAVKSAFATAATMGLTKSKLLETAAHYKNVLHKEKQQFESAMEKQMVQRVASKKQEVVKLKEQITKHQEKIQQLQSQIAKFEHTIDTADEQISGAKQKIETTRDNFERTHQSIVNQIDKDIELINGHL